MLAQNCDKIKFFKLTYYLSALIMLDKIFLLFRYGITLYIIVFTLFTIFKGIY